MSAEFPKTFIHIAIKKVNTGDEEDDEKAWGVIPQTSYNAKF